MADRRILVQIVGDSRSVEDAFRRSGDAATGFNEQVGGVRRNLDELVKVRAGRGKAIGGLRLAGIGLGAGFAIASITKGLGALADGLEVSAEKSETFTGKIRNTTAELLRGDFVGAFQAMTKETHSFTAAQAGIIATTPEVIEMIKKMGDTAALAAASMELLSGLTATPPAVRLAGARAALTPASKDNLDVIRIELEQNRAAVAKAKQQYALGLDQAAIENTLAELLEKRKGILDRRDKIVDELNKKRKVVKEDPFGAVQLGFGLKMDSAKLTQGLADDFAAVEGLIRAIERQIKVEGRTFKLANALVQARLAQSVLAEQQRAQQEAAAAEAQAEADERARKAEERARKAREAAFQRRQRGQFRFLGLTGEGGERPPSVTSLRKRIAAIRETIEGTSLDTPKMSRTLDRFGELLLGKLGKLTPDVRRKIKELLDGMSAEMKKGADSPRFREVSSKAFVNALGLNLTPAQRRRIQQVFTGSVGGRAPAGAGAFAGAGATYITGPVNVYGVRDVAHFENELARRASSRPTIRRGAR